MKGAERPYGPDGARTIWHVAEKNARDLPLSDEERRSITSMNAYCLRLQEFRAHQKERFALKIAVEILQRHDQDLTVENLAKTLGYALQEKYPGKYDSIGMRFILNKHRDLVKELRIENRSRGEIRRAYIAAYEQVRQRDGLVKYSTLAQQCGVNPASAREYWIRHTLHKIYPIATATEEA